MRYMLLSAVAVMTLSLGSANSFAQVQNAADASQSSQNQETSQSQGQSSVVVFGEAENSDGTTEAVLLEQSSSENPLGNPIVGDDSSSNSPTTSNTNMQDESSSATTPNVEVAPSNVVQDNEVQNPSVSQESNPAALNNQIENTLYESDGRVYDVQSYPDTDVEKIEALPQPTITDYPSY